MSNKSVKSQFIIAAPASGCGKTTVTLGLIAALKARGLTVQPFKVGPDYIDPAYHTALAGRSSINLDPWMTDDDFVIDTFQRHSQSADVAIIEGVMGLFDGAGPGDDRGSAAHLAKLLNLPVVLLVDAGACAASAAAIQLGCEQFDPQLRLAGALFNRVAGDSHQAAIRQAVTAACTAPFLGILPKDAGLALPERQLGLISVHEQALPAELIQRLTGALNEHVDISRLLRQTAVVGAPHPTRVAPRPPGQPNAATVRIGIAQDAAFCFYYEDNLRLLRKAGAELVPFSPLTDPALPTGLGGLYLGGGFPEEFAERLAANNGLHRMLREFDRPILAECGGLIFLCREFLDLHGRRHQMVGRVPADIRMTARLQACGYRDITVRTDTVLGRAGTRLRGHEFHWSTWETTPPPEFAVTTEDGRVFGYSDGKAMASYCHAHFGSNPAAAAFFVENCRKNLAPARSHRPHNPAQL